jgi:hypothetical protein
MAAASGQRIRAEKKLIMKKGKLICLPLFTFHFSLS